MNEQFSFDDEWTGPFVATEHPEASHVAARATVARDGTIGQVRQGGHRHKVMTVLYNYPSGLTQEEAGRIAFVSFDVGKGTEAGSDVGRRRCVDLEDMGLIRPARTCASCGGPVDRHSNFEFPDKKTTPWELTELGKEVLARLHTEAVVKVRWLR